MELKCFSVSSVAPARTAGSLASRETTCRHISLQQSQVLRPFALLHSVDFS